MRSLQVIVAAILALIVAGGIGHIATAGYHCHWIQVGNSQACQ